MKDSLANEVKEGDHVHVKIGNDWALGQVVKVQNGGIAVTGVPKNPRDPVGVTMDMIVIQLGIGFNQQPPGSNHVTMLKVATPTPDVSIVM